jgi:MSHA biogenesis protein MshQ
MSLRLVLLRLLVLVLLTASSAARADTPIALWKAFNGRVNFTGTQVSLRTKSNTSGACTVSSSGTNRTAKLSLPAGAAVLSAQLYWAGSGTSDSTVSFEGKSVTASRKYTSSTVGGGFNYFGGAADVTKIVQDKGAGTYNFSGLTVSIGRPWCNSQAVLGGFSLLVVYSHPAEPERVLNLYEGFRYLQNSELIVSASNFRWNRTAIPVREKARIGHITWEGDPTLAQDGERLLFEGSEVSDALNPEGNQFNSKSNINNDSASYGIDFDAYDTSVVIWSGYDALVTTSYRTGQDLVLLNAEILVVPTVPVSDLSVAIARPAGLQVGRNAVYTVTVANNGPYTEAGPITVTQTLPAGMSYVAGSGTGWTCVASGAEVTCTYRAAVAPDTNAAPLTLTAAVTTVGDKTTTVSVKGTGDDNAANNTASNTGTAAPAAVTPGTGGTSGTTSYVFTDSICKAGIAVGGVGQTCKDYSAAMLGGQAGDIYLTAVSGGVVATPSKSKETNVSMQFSLDCVNPASGTIGATYAGIVLPVCAASGLPAAWSGSTTVKFAANEVSVKQAFAYNDIGRVTLSLLAGGVTASTPQFVVAPLRIDFKSIRSGALDNPKSIAPNSAGFAPAGAPLRLEIGALLAGTAGYAPNFGNEDVPSALKLVHAEAVKLVSLGELTQGAPDWAKTKGIATIDAAWSEVGAINFVAGLVDAASPDDASKSNLYLGVPTPGSTVAVGRFYPAYFKTIVSGRFDCPAVVPAPLICPGDKGAVYSQQPFTITVEAYNANNSLVQNFTGDWFRTVTLSAVKEARGELAETALVPTTGAAPVTIAPPPKPADPAAKLLPYLMQAMASFKLASPYVDTLPRPAVGDPRTIAVRATAGDTQLAASGSPATVAVTISSNVEDSEEGGILVLNGRLKLPNALGTDTLRTPLNLRAEYYLGTAGWVFNPVFTDAIAGTVQPLSCPAVAVNFLDPGETCAAVIGAADANPVLMKEQKGGTLWLRAPGKRKNGGARSGSVALRYNSWPWLPSTTGRVSFGSHRSPVIYVRELYF